MRPSLVFLSFLPADPNRPPLCRRARLFSENFGNSLSHLTVRKFRYRPRSACFFRFFFRSPSTRSAAFRPPGFFGLTAPSLALPAPRRKACTPFQHPFVYFDQQASFAGHRTPPRNLRQAILCPYSLLSPGTPFFNFPSLTPMRRRQMRSRTS